MHSTAQARPAALARLGRRASRSEELEHLPLPEAAEDPHRRLRDLEGPREHGLRDLLRGDAGVHVAGAHAERAVRLPRRHVGSRLHLLRAVHIEA